MSVVLRCIFYAATLVGMNADDFQTRQTASKMMAGSLPDSYQVLVWSETYGTPEMRGRCRAIRRWYDLSDIDVPSIWKLSTKDRYVNGVDYAEKYYTRVRIWNQGGDYWIDTPAEKEAMHLYLSERLVSRSLSRFQALKLIEEARPRRVNYEYELFEMIVPGPAEEN